MFRIWAYFLWIKLFDIIVILKNSWYFDASDEERKSIKVHSEYIICSKFATFIFSFKFQYKIIIFKIFVSDHGLCPHLKVSENSRGVDEVYSIQHLKGGLQWCSVEIHCRSTGVNSDGVWRSVHHAPERWRRQWFYF